MGGMGRYSCINGAIQSGYEGSSLGLATLCQHASPSIDKRATIHHVGGLA